MGLPVSGFVEEAPSARRGRLEGKESSYSTGLGLYHTKIMVEALGGRIAVESQVGRGSTFCIHFPVL
jgi:signal transduction histidine kinase